MLWPGNAHLSPSELRIPSLSRQLPHQSSSGYQSAIKYTVVLFKKVDVVLTQVNQFEVSFYQIGLFQFVPEPVVVIVIASSLLFWENFLLCRDRRHRRVRSSSSRSNGFVVNGRPTSHVEVVPPHLEALRLPRPHDLNQWEFLSLLKRRSCLQFNVQQTVIYEKRSPLSFFLQIFRFKSDLYRLFHKKNLSFISKLQSELLERKKSSSSWFRSSWCVDPSTSSSSRSLSCRSRSSSRLPTSGRSRWPTRAAERPRKRFRSRSGIPSGKSSSRSLPTSSATWPWKTGSTGITTSTTRSATNR